MDTLKKPGEEYLLLKWGTIKGWENLSDSSVEILKEFFKDGMCMSCAMDKPNEERRATLCRLIDNIDGEIWSDWDNKQFTKEEAKKYVNDYGEKQ